MKKNKFIALTALTVALGMTACCGGGETGPCEKHTWGEYVETKAATCTEKGSKERTCEVCGEKETKEIGKKSHSYVEETAKRVEPTCTATGKKFSKCSVCGETKEDTLDKIDHDYAATVYTQQQSCTEDGVGTKTCKDCGHVENVREDALDHDWDETVVTQAATCTEDGVGTKTCKRCSTVEADNPKALGHKMKLTETEGAAPEGEAKVQLYSCEHEGCDQTYFGFKAIEVGPGSQGLVFIDPDGNIVDKSTYEGEGELGARFFGRPIGNKLELTDKGDSALGKNIEDLSTVFDETVQGDLFEYVFTLTAEQKALIGDDAVLVCDAKPANYLGGQDFWACDPSAEEWTRGMYIEDDDDGHKAGDPINTYRYILYVDDAPVAFDPSMKAPVKTGAGGQANLDRNDFVLPYVFHLKEGQNKISLRMAGGYRSIFYNFTFRPYEAPVIPPEPAKLGSWSAIDYTSASEGIEKNANGITMKSVYNVGTPGTQENSWKQTAPVAETDASEGDKVVYTVKADKAVTNAKLFMTVNYGQAYGTVPVFSKVANDGTKGYVWNGTAWNQTDYRYKVIVNGTEVELNAKAEGYEEPNFVAGRDVVAEFPCTFNLNAGDNTIEIQNYGGYNPLISKFEVQAANGVDAKISVTPHEHDFVIGDKAESSALRTVSACSRCGMAGYELQAADATEGQKEPSVNGTSSADKNTRLGKNSIMDDVWNVTGIEAGTYAVYMNARCSAGNKDSGCWNSAYAVDTKHDSVGNNGGTEELAHEYKYKIKVDEGEYVNLGGAEQTYGEAGLNENTPAWTCQLATITIAEGATTITVHNMNNGYGIWVYGIRLIKIA